MTVKRILGPLVLGAAFVLAVGSAVMASGMFSIPTAAPEDEPGVPEASIPAGYVPATAVEQQAAELQEDFGSAPVRARTIVDAAGGDLTARLWKGDEGVQWSQVRFELANGDQVVVNVQSLTAVATPGSHFQPDWILGRVGPYEAVFEPRDDANTSEAVWLLTEHFQIGVSLIAPPQSRLKTAPGAGQLEAVALRVAEAVERNG